MNRRFIFGVVLSVTSTAMSLASAETTSHETPSVKGALSDSVWYDADQDGVLPVTVEPEVDDSLNRESRWLPKPEKVEKKKAAAPVTAGGSTGLFGSDLTLGNLLGWLFLISTLATAIGLVIYAMSKAEIDLMSNPASRRGSGANDRTPDEQMIERMKHLPAELRRTDVNLRSEAERLMNAGQFDQAIILLFGHQLLLLDRVGMLRLNRGKTNRKYLRETRDGDTSSADRLQLTVDAFERSYFGRHSLSATEFQSLWKANDELENRIQTAQGAVA